MRMDNKFLVWDLNQLALFSAPQSKVIQPNKNLEELCFHKTHAI